MMIPKFIWTCAIIAKRVLKGGSSFDWDFTPPDIKTYSHHNQNSTVLAIGLGKGK